MKSLFLRIWLTVVAALLLFALVSYGVVLNHNERERVRTETAANERLEVWGDYIQRSLPGADSDSVSQTGALNDWSQRLRIPLALEDRAGRRVATSDSFARREGGPAGRRVVSVSLSDGRTLLMMRLPPLVKQRAQPPDMLADALPPGALQLEEGARGEVFSGSIARFPPGPAPPQGAGPSWQLPLVGPSSTTQLAGLLAMLFVAVAAGAYPVARRLTRRLELLERGVVAFGHGALHQRVHIDGSDEVATLATSFNGAAERIETLVRSHQSLLANASHELRSPLARMKMALAMLDDAKPAQRIVLADEINTNIAELDALVEEVLLASRIEAGASFDPQDGVDLLGLAAEECARVGATAEGEALKVRGDERLLRRALRNLLENAKRYGGGEIEVVLGAGGPSEVEIRVDDRGPGVPEAERERIFEAFYRMPGHAEVSGGVGLGLSLVRQIAERHGGSVRCEPRDGGGSSFVIRLPG